MYTLKNDGVLPTLLEYESEARFSKTNFSDDQILKMLRALLTLIRLMDMMKYQSEC